MGREKKYRTPASLSKAIDRYLSAVCYERPVMSLEGEKSKPVFLKNGEPAIETVYLSPVSVSGLCVELGISRQTWASYGKDPVFASLVEGYRLRSEVYWEHQLTTGTGKGVQGASFALKANFGWRDKQDMVVVGGGQSLEDYLARTASEGQEF